MLKALFKNVSKIDIKKVNNNKFLAKLNLTNKYAYGKSIDEAIMNLKKKIKNDKTLLSKPKKTKNNSKKVSLSSQENLLINNNNISLKNFSYEVGLHVFKLMITLIVIGFFTLIATNIFINQLESRLSNITIFEKLENIANRFDNSIAEFNNEISELRPLEKLEHEIIDMAREKNEFDPEKQKQIVDSLRILKNRIKPFLDAIKD